MSEYDHLPKWIPLDEHAPGCPDQELLDYVIVSDGHSAGVVTEAGTEVDLAKSYELEAPVFTSIRITRYQRDKLPKDNKTPLWGKQHKTFSPERGQMKASALRDKLEKLIEEHGDLELFFESHWNKVREPGIKVGECKGFGDGYPKRMRNQTKVFCVFDMEEGSFF